MTQVQVTEPFRTPLKIHDDEPHRVCAYCRVSTEEEDQRNSLASQIQFFSEYFERKPNWINIGIFADEGLSGTSLEKRDRFNTMLRAARQGKVDIILTKEVSRFSRNVQDLLNVVVELRGLGVYVWFLSDDINTEENDYRERLTQIAMSAEQESLRTSRRVKWGHQQQMQRGVVFGRREMFGYEIVRDQSGKQNFVVIPEEAVVIKQIFEWFSSGDGTHTIVKRLEQMGVRPKRYRNGWSNTVILRLLRNEKYVGDLVQGKTYTPDPLTHKKKYNHGEYYRYYTENHHIPIIDRELWNQVQDILKSKEPDDEVKGKHSNRYWCSGKVFCGLCAGRYISLSKKQKTGRYKAWGCIKNHRSGRYKEIMLDTGEAKRVGCNGRRINDRVLQLAVHDILEQILLPIKDDILTDLKDRIIKEYRPLDLSGMITDIERKIENTEDSLDGLTIQLAKKVITQERYRRVSNIRDREIEDLKKELAKLRALEHASVTEGDHFLRCMEHMKKILDLSDSPLNEEFYERIIKKIVVYPLCILEIHFAAMSSPVMMQYQAQGRGDAYTASFTILTQEQFDSIRKDISINDLPSCDRGEAAKA